MLWSSPSGLSKIWPYSGGVGCRYFFDGTYGDFSKIYLDIMLSHCIADVIS